jgi:trigger factor
VEEQHAMKVECRTEPGSRAVLEIDVPEDEVARAMDQAYAHLVRRVQIPGFRPGKAPRAILERHVGTEALREEALRRLVPERYSAAVAQAGIEPVARPSIEVKEGPDGKGLRIVATVDVYPKVTLPDYRALRVPPERRPVTDEEVDRALEDLRARHGRLVSAGGEPARPGDFVLLTVTAAPEGLDRLTPGKELLVEVGGGLLPEAVEAALEGARAGDDRTVRVGDAGEVTVHIVDVRRKDLPALDDAFARTVSDQPTLEALREGLRRRLVQERAERDARETRERVLDAVLARTQVDLPESLVQHEIDHMLEELDSRLRSRGLSLESYLKTRAPGTGAAPEGGEPPAGAGEEAALQALRAETRPAAERRVRARLLLEAVAEREALAVGEEEMAAEVENLAGDLRQDVPKVRAWLAERGRYEGLRENALRRKAMALLVDLVAGAPEASRSPGTPAEGPGAETRDEPAPPA